jgi:hypothetical protein
MRKRLAVRIAVFASALFFLPPILLAQHRSGHRGGGHAGLGSHRGGGHRGFTGGGRSGGRHGGHRHHGGHGGVGFRWWGGYYSPYSYYGPYGGYGYYGRYPYSYRYDSLPDWAAIDTDIAPEEAEIYLDGRYIGIADDFDGYPDYLYLEPGKYRLEFRLEGYETRSLDIQARRGTKFDIDEKLQRIPGARRYSGGRRDSDPNAQRFWGKSRDSSETVTREPIDSEQVDSNREDQRGPDGDREPETRLRLSAEPSDAAVYVDDRFIGTAEEVNSRRRGISLSPGKHTVTVLRPGFEGKTLDVQIDEGKTEELQVSLSR